MAKSYSIAVNDPAARDPSEEQLQGLEDIDPLDRTSIHSSEFQNIGDANILQKDFSVTTETTAYRILHKPSTEYVRENAETLCKTLCISESSRFFFSI